MAIWVHIEVNNVEGGGPMVGLSGANAGSKSSCRLHFVLLAANWPMADGRY
jgi:hypothetical protein